MKSGGEPVPRTGRLLGIDYGTVRVGVAISDRDQRLASPLENYTRRSEATDAAYFQQLVEQEQIAGLVVGLPVHGDGSESQKSFEARAYGEWLQKITGLPVSFYDERYSSVQAEGFLLGAGMTSKRRKKRLDMLAAQIMLAGFLESSRAESSDAIDD